MHSRQGDVGGRGLNVVVHVRWCKVARAPPRPLALRLGPSLQARRDRAEMELSSRSHEMLMGEMAVLVRGYRRELTRLYQVNRAIAQRLAELETKVSTSTFE